MSQVMVRLAEVLGSGSDRDFVSRKPQIAKHQFVIWRTILNYRLQPAVVLHAVGQCVADIANVIARSEFESRLVRNGRLHECDNRGHCENDATDYVN